MDHALRAVADIGLCRAMVASRRKDRARVKGERQEFQPTTKPCEPGIGKDRSIESIYKIRAEARAKERTVGVVCGSVWSRESARTGAAPTVIEYSRTNPARADWIRV